MQLHILVLLRSCVDPGTRRVRLRRVGPETAKGRAWRQGTESVPLPRLELGPCVT